MLKFLKLETHFNIMNFNTLCASSKYGYEDTIKALNSLIGNSSIIKQSCDSGTELRLQHVPRTKNFCERAGIQLSDIDNLNVIHVAGTKGKGSTCTYIEAILRHSGYKTGLFTSPHLKEVRERIKINGCPLSASDFNHYFWPVFEKISETKTHPHDLPFYFQFLTVLAFDVFIKEKVDFVILETGIGGRFDSTNIISRPTIGCITSLGYDHTEILGLTMSEISWNKAGIIKPKSVIFTCDNLPKEALEVIENEVMITDSKLFLVPISGEKAINIINKQISVHNENVILASSICQMITDKDFASIVENQISSNNTIKIPPEVCLKENHKEIIYSTTVSGRYQIIKKSGVKYYIDGAHTVESIKTTVEWFEGVTKDKKFDKRYLVFMITGSRSPENLLSQITVLNFDGILLCPLVPFNEYKPCDLAIDSGAIEREKCKLSEIAATWTRLNLLMSAEKKHFVKYFPNFSDISQWLQESGETTQVLVVGSLHLVGCALTVLS